MTEQRIYPDNRPDRVQGNRHGLGSVPLGVWRQKAVSYLRRGHKPQKIRMLVLGRHVNDGFLFKLAIYVVLTSAAALYVKPLMYMLTTSLKSVIDLNDPTIHWLPSRLEWDNYSHAFTGLDYLKALIHTLLLAVGGAILQMASCALTGFAFARLTIPGKNILFFIVLVTFLIPQQTLAIPLFVTYSKLGWLNTPLPFLVPALFAQGIKGALFIIIFRQFFSTLPKALEDSARMDGAGELRIFWKIMLPLARPALLIVFLFSFVWHWNDFFEPSLYLNNGTFVPLSLSMDYLQGNLINSVSNASTTGGVNFNVSEPIQMASAFLIILPPLLVYMFAQRHFVEGIERTGIIE